jgi:hypothetical protein
LFFLCFYFCVSSAIPEGIQATCNELAANVPTIIQLLENKVTPDAICALLGVCTSSPSSSKKAPKHSPAIVGDCSVCTDVVTTVQYSLSANVSVPDIVAIVDAMCNDEDGEQSCDILFGDEKCL